MSFLNKCPNCEGELTDTGVPHCASANRQKPCGWITHRSCGSVVDPRRATFYGGKR